MINKLEKTLAIKLNEDIGKLMLRLSIGGLMLFHGIHKALHGIVGIKAMVMKASLPEFLAYGVYIGEIVVPILIILGLFTRLASIALAINMLFAIFLAYGNNLFATTNTGGLLIELPLFYLLSSIVLIFIGAGKHSLDNRL